MCWEISYGNEDMSYESKIRLTAGEFFSAFGALAGVFLVGSWMVERQAVWVQVVGALPLEIGLLVLMRWRLRDVGWHSSVLLPVVLMMVLLNLFGVGITTAMPEWVETGMGIYAVGLVATLWVMPGNGRL